MNSEQKGSLICRPTNVGDPWISSWVVEAFPMYFQPLLVDEKYVTGVFPNKRIKNMTIKIEHKSLIYQLI